MIKICGICIYWEFKGFLMEYDENEGDCCLKGIRKMSTDICDYHETDPLLLED